MLLNTLTVMGCAAKGLRPVPCGAAAVYITWTATDELIVAGPVEKE